MISIEHIKSLQAFLKRVPVTGEESVAWCALNFALNEELAQLSKPPAAEPEPKKRPYDSFEGCFNTVTQWHVLDNFLPNPEAMLESALRSGFGRWHPKKGDLGPDYFDGVNFYGDHARGVRMIVKSMGGPIYTNKMFFRVTTEKTDPAVVHSDRFTGDITCLVYLSKHKDSGTEFYRHKPTGLYAMPPLEWLLERPALFEQLKKDCSGRDPEVWEKIGAAEAQWNRAIFFPSAVFHCRYPYTGFGAGEDAEGRIVWGCHFMLEGNSHV